MRVLITGIRGFVGHNLAIQLAKEHRVFGLSRAADGRNTFSWDDLSHGRVPAVDAIIHLAALVHDTNHEARPDEYFKINTGLTQKIYEYFCRHGEISKFIFFSTQTVSTGIHTPYGESKRRAEQFIIDNIARANGRQVCILRPCMIYGPGNKGNLNLLYNIVSRGLPWPLGAFDNRRSFVSVVNVGHIVSQILMTKIDNGVYDIADDETMSTNELVATICQAIGRKPRILKVPKWIVRAAAQAGDKIPIIPLNTERLSKLTEDYVVNNTPIKTALGINRMPVNTHDGILAAIRSLDRHA